MCSLARPERGKPVTRFRCFDHHVDGSFHTTRNTLHVLVTTQPTGGNGIEYTIQLIGLGQVGVLSVADVIDERDLPAQEIVIAAAGAVDEDLDSGASIGRGVWGLGVSGMYVRRPHQRSGYERERRPR